MRGSTVTGAAAAVVARANGVMTELRAALGLDEGTSHVHESLSLGGMCSGEVGDVCSGRIRPAIRIITLLCTQYIGACSNPLHISRPP